MRTVTQIEPKWLLEYASDFYSQADPNKISKAKRSQKIEPLFDKHATEWRISRRGFGTSTKK